MAVLTQCVTEPQAQSISSPETRVQWLIMHSFRQGAVAGLASGNVADCMVAPTPSQPLSSLGVSQFREAVTTHWQPEDREDRLRFTTHPLGQVRLRLRLLVGAVLLTTLLPAPGTSTRPWDGAGAGTSPSTLVFIVGLVSTSDTESWTPVLLTTWRAGSAGCCCCALRGVHNNTETMHSSRSLCISAPSTQLHSLVLRL